MLFRLHESSGEAESLYGKIDPKKFGDSVYRSSPPENIQKKKRECFVVSEATMQNKKRRRIPGEESSVLNWRAEEGGAYQPKTKETRAAYESMLSLIQHQLCGQPLNIVSAAADEILAVLNDDNFNNSDKKKMEIEKLLNESISYQLILRITKKTKKKVILMWCQMMKKRMTMCSWKLMLLTLCRWAVALMMRYCRKLMKEWL